MRVRSRTLSVTGIVAMIALAALVVLLLGDGAGGTARPDRAGILEITLEDDTLQPSSFVLPAGEPVTLVFVNEQGFSHNLAFGRSVIEQDGHPIGFGEDLLAGVDARVDPPRAWIEPRTPEHGVTLSVPDRQTVTMEVTLPADRVGTWHVGCFRGPGCDPRVGVAAELTVE